MLRNGVKSASHSEIVVKKKVVFLMTLIVFTVNPVCSAHAKTIHHEYEISLLKEIKHDGSGIIKMQLAKARTFESKNFLVSHKRIQFMNENGEVVAFTPTRISAIPFCISLENCWVFMWKSVYPLPAIFKLNSDQSTWVKVKKPVMIYSRSGYAGEGFVERINPFFGIFGLILFVFHNFVFFSVLISISMYMFFQIAKYHDLPISKKNWVKKILMILNILMPIPFPNNPYVLLAFIICIMSIGGMACFGIPLVITVLTIFGALLFFAYYPK